MKIGLAFILSETFPVRKYLFKDNIKNYRIIFMDVALLYLLLSLSKTLPIGTGS